MNKNKIIILASSIITVLAISIYFFKKNHKEKKPPFEIAIPERKNIVQYVNASGTLNARDEITVGSLVAGRVIKVLAESNDFVKENQLLVILDDGIGYSAVKAYKARLAEAKARLNFQEKYYRRQTELYNANQISKNIFEQYTRDLIVAKEFVNQTEGELEIREQEYNNLFIKSPANGVVIAKEVDLGQMITARFQATVLYKIAKDLHEMEAHVDVDEADVGLVEEGQEATFTVDAFPKLKFKAKVRQIRYLAKIVDNVVTYATILDVDNPKLKLRPGMTTNVNIKVKEVQNALVVHNKSLRINGIVLEEVAKKIGFNVIKAPISETKTEIDHVWILKDENTFEQIAIEIGAKQGPYTQIISDKINDSTKILTSVEDVNKKNNLLEQAFAKPGSIGSNQK